MPLVSIFSDFGKLDFGYSDAQLVCSSNIGTHSLSFTILDCTSGIALLDLLTRFTRPFHV